MSEVFYTPADIDDWLEWSANNAEKISAQIEAFEVFSKLGISEKVLCLAFNMENLEALRKKHKSVIDLAEKMNDLKKENESTRIKSLKIKVPSP